MTISRQSRVRRIGGPPSPGPGPGPGPGPVEYLFKRRLALALSASSIALGVSLFLSAQAAPAATALASPPVVLNAADQQASQVRNELLKLIDESVALLPESFFSALKAPISVRIETGGSYVAMARGHTVSLGRQFMKLLALDPRTDFSGSSEVHEILFAASDLPAAQLVLPMHKTVHQYLLAALVHEYAHVFDRNANKLGTRIKALPCRVGRERTVQPNAPCHLSYNERSRAISDSYEFLNLVHHHNKRSLVNRDATNTLIERTADPYETTNSDEAFAVNFEYFVLDSEYKCRRPGLYELFSNLLEFKPHQDRNCGPTSAVLLNDLLDPEEALAPVSFNRLYSVEYLLADGGSSSLASRWGHSMVRFVFCPENQEMSDSCRARSQNSLVLTFRGIIDDLVQNALKGLTGGYLTSALFRGLPAVQGDYNLLEFRNLRSIPLQVSEAEKQALLKQALEYHWAYQSQYAFITNNCAVETLNFFKTALPARTKLQVKTAITPADVLQDLLHAGLVTTGVAAQEYVDFYPSKKPIFEKAVAIIQVQTGVVLGDPEGYEALSSELRTKIVEAATNSGDPKLLAATLLLHDRFYKKREKVVFAELMIKAQKDFNLRNNRVVVEAEQRTTDYIELMRMVSAPGSLLPTRGYGIPNQAELAALQEALRQSNIGSLAESIETIKTELFNEPEAGLDDLRLARVQLAKLKEGLRIGMGQVKDSWISRN